MYPMLPGEILQFQSKLDLPRLPSRDLLGSTGCEFLYLVLSRLLLCTRVKYLLKVFNRVVLHPTRKRFLYHLPRWLVFAECEHLFSLYTGLLLARGQCFSVYPMSTRTVCPREWKLILYPLCCWKLLLVLWCLRVC